MSVDQPLPPPQPPGKPRRWRRTMIVIGSILGVLLLVAAGGVYLVYTKFQQIKVIQVEGMDAPPQDNQPRNILLLGSDSRKGKHMAKYGQDAGRGGQRSDTTILLHISADRSRALAVSIPRDTWVEQPACASSEAGYFAKFNNAFDMGGPACTSQLVEQLTGVQIDDVVVVDFNGFKELIDAMGGVEVCVNHPIHDQDSLLDLPAGTSVISGDRALAFVRARKTIGDGSDIGRIQRQQAFLSAAIRKVTDPGFLLNPARVYQMLDVATNSLTVSQGLDGVLPMKDLVDSVRSIKPDDVTFVTMPFVYRTDGANVDEDKAASASLWNAMRTDTPWPPPPTVASDGQKLTVAPADIWVDVVNASGGSVTSGALAKQFQAAGFNINAMTDGKSRAATAVDYPAGQEDSARTVGYAVSAAPTQDSGISSIRVVVGKDFAGVKTEMVIVKPKATKNPTENTTKADEVVCAN